MEANATHGDKAISDEVRSGIQMARVALCDSGWNMVNKKKERRQGERGRRTEE